MPGDVLVVRLAVLQRDVPDGAGADGVLLAGQGLGGATNLPVQLFEHSRIFTPEGDEKTRDDIVSGAEALVAVGRDRRERDGVLDGR